MKGNKGITLIALVITIIVLLILAGVTISMLFGDNGLISRAQNAGESWNQAEKNELEGLDNLEGDMDKYINGGTLNPGDTTSVPSDEDWDESKVTPTSDGDGNVIPIPKGFYYVGGTKSTGVVISDSASDKNKGTSHEIAQALVRKPVCMGASA